MPSTSGNTTPITGVTYTRAMTSLTTPPLSPKQSRSTLNSNLPRYASSTTASRTRSSNLSFSSTRSRRTDFATGSSEGQPNYKHGPLRYSADSGIEVLAKPRPSFSTPRRPSTSTLPKISVDKQRISHPLESRPGDTVTTWARGAEQDLQTAQESINRDHKPSLVSRASTHIRNRSRSEKTNAPQTTPSQPTPLLIRIRRGQQTFYHSSHPAASRPTHPLERSGPDDTTLGNAERWAPAPVTLRPLPKPLVTSGRLPSSTNQTPAEHTKPKNMYLVNSHDHLTAQTFQPEAKTCWYDSSDDDSEDVRQTKIKGRDIEKRGQLFRSLVKEKSEIVEVVKPLSPTVDSVDLEKTKSSLGSSVLSLGKFAMAGTGARDSADAAYTRGAAQSSSLLPIKMMQSIKYPTENGMLVKRLWNKVVLGFSERKREKKMRAEAQRVVKVNV